MYTFLISIHVIIGILLVLIVLIQSGRSGGLSGLMGGGGGGDALFTATSQQSGLRKATIIIAIIFMSTSLGLTILSSRKVGQSVIQRQLPVLPPIPAPAPAPVEEAPNSGTGNILPPTTGE